MLIGWLTSVEFVSAIGVSEIQGWGMEKAQEGNQQIVDERVNSLFRDLKRLREEMEKPNLSDLESISSRGRQFDLPNINNTSVLNSTVMICPFLKASWNPTVQYGFPNEENYCYKGKKPGPVPFDHQEKVCYTKQFARCPVAQPVQMKQRLLALLENLF